MLQQKKTTILELTENLKLPTKGKKSISIATTLYYEYDLVIIIILIIHSNQDWDQLWSRWDSIQVHKRPSNNGLKKMVRHQLVAMKGIKSSFMVTLRSVYSDEGISGLYKQGFSEVVYSSLRFGLYKQLIIAFGTNTNGHDSPAWMNVLAGITH